MIDYVIMGGILLFLLLLLAVGAKYCPEGNSGFFDQNNSRAMRGFWCLIVILVHISPQYQNLIQDMIGSFAYIGVIMLGFQEQKLHREAVELGPDKKKPRLGAVALLFPMLYNLADAASLAAIGITVSGESGAYMPNNDFFIFECAGFALVSVFVWLYMLLVKKHFYNPFQESEMVRCGAATGETFGTMTFIFAAAQNPVLTPPITSAYCLVTVLLARLFLKERLSKKRYITLGLLAVGILLLNI